MTGLSTMVVITTLEGGSGRDRLEGGSGDFLSYEGSGSGVNVDLSDRSPATTLSEADAALFDVTDANRSVPDVIKVSGGDASGDIATGFVQCHRRPWRRHPDR